ALSRTGGVIRTSDPLLRSNPVPILFFTSAPINFIDLHQLREPAFAQKRNPFSCTCIGSKGVSLRFSYAWGCRSGFSCLRLAQFGPPAFLGLRDPLPHSGGKPPPSAS